jgi:hypothetical protein
MNKSIDIKAQFGEAMGMHPLTTILAGTMNALGCFMTTFDTANPSPEIRKAVSVFIGSTLITLGQDFIQRVQEKPDAGQDPPQIVSSDGSPLGGAQ